MGCMRSGTINQNLRETEQVHTRMNPAVIAHGGEGVNKTVYFLLASLMSITANAHEPTPFCVSDFCVITSTDNAQSRFKIEYQPRPCRSRPRPITKSSFVEELPRIAVEPPISAPFAERNETADMYATMSTSLGGASQACAWSRDGRPLEESELMALAHDPVRAILLREKPEWTRLKHYAMYLDPAVIFIFPGPLLANLEQAER